MKPDSVEIELESAEADSLSTYNISLRVVAYLTAEDGWAENKIVFDCDPAGDNYRRTYLDVKFKDWDTVAQIRDFLSHHLSDRKGKSRTLTVPVEEGHYSLHHFDGDVDEYEDFDEISVRATENRIEFGGMSNMTPYIYTFERSEDGVPGDENNVTELLNFFEEITAEQPIPSAKDSESGEQSANMDVHRLFNQYSVTAQLNAIGDLEDQINQDYQKAVREFNGREYDDAVRDVGRSGETLIEELCLQLYGEKETPDGMTARLNKLDKTEEGLPSYIGKVVSPAWWLRNKANHPTEYEITKADAHYALLCFQTAVEKYVEDYLEADVVY